MSDQMKLTEISEEAFALPSAFEKVWKILYSVDPVLLRRFDKDQLIRIAKVNINYRIQIAQAELNILKVQMDMKNTEINALKDMMGMLG